MSSAVRNKQKRKERLIEMEIFDNERMERERHFSDIVEKLSELGIDAHLLAEYLDYIR